MAVTQFEDIYLDLSGKKGRLRLADSGLGWKAPGSDQPFTVPAAEIRKATWSRASRGFELRFTLKNGNFVVLDGFSSGDIDALKEPIKSYYNIPIEIREHSYKGWNWGVTDFSGQELLFNVNSKPAFEIPLSTVSNANLSGKNEVALEFSLPGDKSKEDAKEMDQLVEMRFYIPGTAVKEGSEKGSGDEQNDQEEMSAANLFYETIKDKADIGQVAGESIVSFQDLLFVTPRGRYDVDMYPSSLRLRGKTYDYKISYSSIAKLFLLPKPDDMHVVFVVGLDPPLRQGQTRYPFLVAQFLREEEIEVELNLEEAEFNEKYSEKLLKSYDAPTYEVVSQIFRGLSGRKVTTPSTFKSHHGHCAVKCSQKANEGHLFLLEKSFLFIPKPPIFIPVTDVAAITLSRAGSGAAAAATKTFDMTFQLKGNTEHQFSNVNREEQSPLEEYFKSKGIKVRNDLDEDSSVLIAAVLDEDISDGDSSEDRPNIRSPGAGRLDDDDSVDEDFQEGTESEVEEEYDSEANPSVHGDEMDED